MNGYRLFCSRCEARKTIDSPLINESYYYGEYYHDIQQGMKVFHTKPIDTYDWILWTDKWTDKKYIQKNRSRLCGPITIKQCETVITMLKT